MRRKIVPVVSLTLFGLLLAASANSGRTVEILLPAKSLSVAAPVEAALGAGAKQGEVLEAASAKGDSFLLQDAPALFQSPDGVDLQRMLCAVLPEGVAAGSRQLRVVRPTKPTFSFVSLDGGRMQLLEGDRPVFVYNYGMQLAPGSPEDRRRSTYIHPVYDLDGRAMTDDFPADHYHHRGLSWMWPRVTVEGKQLDLWHIRGIRQSFEMWLAQEVGPVCATLGVKNSWHLTDRKVKVMDEWVWVRVFRAGEHGRAIDVRITWRALQPIEILGQVDSGYGGFVLRLTKRQGTSLVTTSGLQAKDSDLQTAAWADESGKFAGSAEDSGVAIFQHPSNPGFPTGWTLRGADNYGFLGVAWPGVQPAKMEPGRPVTLRYRVWIHRGDAQTGHVEDAFSAFSEPPVLRPIADSTARKTRKAPKKAP